MSSRIRQSRNLRKRQTSAERILWSRIRSRRLGGFKFRRQHGLANYIVDFYCEELKLVVELDGDLHGYAGKMVSDKTKEAFLMGRSFKVVRYTNLDVYENLDGVLNDLLVRCSEVRERME